MATLDSLAPYRAKRNFGETPEPAQGGTPSSSTLTFVIQKHAARNLHYDFRLELGGTLKSWALPKGPSLDPTVKRMGVHVEDHPLSYASFEGQIPSGQYGAGDVIVWDRGLWSPLGDPAAGLKSGKLKFELYGEKLKGHWTLVRMQGRGDGAKEQWLLIKEKDEHARPSAEFDVLQALPDSVLSGVSLPKKVRASNNEVTRAQFARVKVKPRSRKSLATDMPERALKSPLPDQLAPQLATLVEHVPAEDGEWSYEIKFDGYRLLTRIDGKSIRLLTRNGHDWTEKLPALAKALSEIGMNSGWLDGEIVVLNAQGLPDFGALQNAFDHSSTASIVYYLFDLPFLNGLDLRQVALYKRRLLLAELLRDQNRAQIRFSSGFDEAPQNLLTSAQRLGLEGIMAKRKDSRYTSGRSSGWLKLKTRLRQEFVIGGYTEPKGSRTSLGALLLGVHDDTGKLIYAGSVGTGFDDTALRKLHARLKKIQTLRAPFSDLPPSVHGHWVQPQLLAEIEFSEWTRAGRIRHAVFQGLRSDKPAEQVVKETAMATEPTARKKRVSTNSMRSSSSSPCNSLRSVRITHAERVIDPSTGFTKQNLVEFYASVAPLMLPHLKARPIALARAPTGIGGELFFQKHADASAIPGIKLLDPALDPGHAPLLEVSSAQALLSAAQFNAIEFHTWNATARYIGKPDRMTFDLDPGEGVGWAQVQEAAQLVRALLDELGLSCFLKTSGGKGLHIVVPLRRAASFDVVKDFSHAIVKHLASVIPQRFVAKSGPKNRIGKIFLDYLRKGFGATTVAAWSARARPGMGVSVPVEWEELASLTGGAHWTVSTVGGRLATGNHPWEAYESCRRCLGQAMKKLDFKPTDESPRVK